MRRQLSEPPVCDAGITLVELVAVVAVVAVLASVTAPLSATAVDAEPRPRRRGVPRLALPARAD